MVVTLAVAPRAETKALEQVTPAAQDRRRGAEAMARGELKVRKEAAPSQVSHPTRVTADSIAPSLRSDPGNREVSHG